MKSANQCLPAQIKTAKTYITTKMIASAETGFSTALVLLICNLNHVEHSSRVATGDPDVDLLCQLPLLHATKPYSYFGWALFNITKRQQSLLHIVL